MHEIPFVSDRCWMTGWLATDLRQICSFCPNGHFIFLTECVQLSLASIAATYRHYPVARSTSTNIGRFKTQVPLLLYGVAAVQLLT